MKVEFLFVADYAVAQEDGRLNAVGAGIRFITAPRFPHTIPNMTIAISMDFEEREIGQHFRVETSIIAPDGTAVLGPVDLAIILPAPKQVGAPNLLRATVSAQQFQLKTPGEYKVVVAADGKVLKSLVITAGLSGRSRRS